jgi:ABC-type glycerol-3-phosphate transport system substrate-binding protein
MLGGAGLRVAGERRQLGRNDMKRLLIGVLALVAMMGVARAETLRILMETVPDTEQIKSLLPEFKAATGYDVEIEAISYIDMHTKLVPQLIAPTGAYDIIIVDFYWVAEFTKAGWLLPLDEYAQRDGVDLGRYVPKVMATTGQVDGVTYMLPFYNYVMGLVYRKDLLEDPAEQAAFKEKYGIDLGVPKTWDEFKKQMEFFTRDTDGDGQNDFFGTVTQAQRGDCIMMQSSNFLYGNGARYYDDNWNPLLNTPEAVQGLTDFADATLKYSAPGSEGFCFDEAVAVMTQGKAYSIITFNNLYATINNPETSAAGGKVGIAGVPGGGLMGAWGWGIPKSSADKDGAWAFINWVESYDVAKRRAIMGNAMTQTALFTDPDVVAARPEAPSLEPLVAEANAFPVFTYTVEFVEAVGREFNLAASGQKDPKEAAEAAQEAFAELLRKDGLIE